MTLSASALALAISAALSVGAPQASTTVSTAAPAPQTVRQYVSEQFSDLPIMAAVASCESHYRQFDTDGSVFRGEINNQDVGVFQINEYYHLKEAQALGYDIYTLDGNVAFARYLYEHEGTAPWSSSAPCWTKSEAAKNARLASAAN